MFTELPASGLVVLLAAPASGKSTFADLAFAHGDVIATDDIRGLAGGSRDALEATPDSIDILYTIVRHRLRIGLFTVVDSTGTTEGMLGRLADLAEATSSPIHYIHVEAPLIDCHQRNRSRGHGRVPNEALNAMAERVEELRRELDRAGHQVAPMSSYLQNNLAGRSAFLAMPVTENIGANGFRQDKRQFYERVHAALHISGLKITSAAINEEYGSIKLDSRVYASYDIKEILSSDCLLVGTTSSLSPDIYLEIGTAIGAAIPVGLAMPQKGRMTGMLRGLVETGVILQKPIEEDDQLARSLADLAMDMLGVGSG